MPPESNVESTLIWYDAGKPDNMKYWIEETERFLESKYNLISDYTSASKLPMKCLWLATHWIYRECGYDFVKCLLNRNHYSLDFLSFFSTPLTSSTQTTAYRNAPGAENRVKCDFDNPPPEGKVCIVNIDGFYPCTRDNQFNYPKAAPCIFLKLNKVILCC